MKCPSCPIEFWALFIGQDGVYRCRACRDRLSPLEEVVYYKQRSIGDERPYITRRKKVVAGVKPKGEK